MKPFLIIPVENQVRELDAKLLVSVLAAQEGWTSVIGSKWSIHERIGRFPPGIYIAKSFIQRDVKMLKIMRRIGHYVIAWDEEAVVTFPPEIYYARRVGRGAFNFIDLLVAWGEENRDLLYGHPECRRETVHVLGNPRADLLRPEMRELFQDRVDELRREYGDFILINTNFNAVNCYLTNWNLLYVDQGEWVRGYGAAGMPEDYVKGRFEYKQATFEAYQALIPAIAKAFPSRRIILRPHPSENHDLWRRFLEGCANVEVNSKGNVVPWLIACDCLIQSGCTTAVEGFLLGTRIVSFVPVEDQGYEFRLPNEMGTQCRTADEVIAAVQDPAPDRDPAGTRRRFVGRAIYGFDGELASARLLKLLPHRSPYASLAHLSSRLSGMVSAERRATKKRKKMRAGDPRYSADYRRQRFPHIEVSALQEQAERLRRITGVSRPVEVKRRHEDIFEVRPA